MHRRGFAEIERPAITSAITKRLDNYARGRVAAEKKAELEEVKRVEKKRRNDGRPKGGKKMKREFVLVESEEEDEAEEVEREREEMDSARGGAGDGEDALSEIEDDEDVEKTIAVKTE